MPATTTLLGLVTPTQGTLSGTWGDTVNYGISDYVDISVAGTLTLTNDGAVTLANTTGSSAGNSITSSLTGAGTVTAQFAIVKVTGTLTVAKVVTGPSYSKTYTVVNSATGGIVTFKASGQTGVSIAVGESAFVYYNGTDYVKVSGTVAVASFQTSLGGLTPSTATTGVVTLAGTLNTTSGGTGLTSFTAGDVPYYASGTLLSKLAIGTAGQFLTSTGTAPQWSTLSGVAVTTFSAGTTGFTPSSATSGAVTLAGTLATTNGGTGLTSFTANGVVFASSSSVLATGSALTFNGTAFATTGTGSFTGNLAVAGGAVPVASGYQYGIAVSTGGTIGVRATSNDYRMRIGTNFNLDGTHTNTTSNPVSLITMDNGITTFSIGASGTAGNAISYTSAMTLDASGNLGIGTSSPAQKLHVNVTSGAVYELISSGSNNLYLGYENTRAVSVIQSNNALVFDVGSGYTERVRIDTSGNVSVGGFAPSAWSVGKAIEIGNVGNAVWCVSATQITMPQNAYFDGAWRYGANGFATRYAQETGVHQWWNAPSGTAGNAVTFTQAMTLDASGNLGLGSTTTAGGRLVITQSNSVQPAIYLPTDESTIQGPNANTKINMGSNLYLYSSSVLGFVTAGTERARIDTSGRFLIGGTTTYDFNGQSNLVVNGTAGLSTITIASPNGGYIAFADGTTGTAPYAGNIEYNHSTNVLSFGTNGIFSRVNIDSSGNLLVGTNTEPFARGYTKYIAVSSTGSTAIEINAASGSTAYLDLGANSVRGLSFESDGTNNSISAIGAKAIAFNTNSNERMRITSTGNVGIGTSSPANPTGGIGVEVSNSSGASLRLTNSTTYLDLQSGTNANYIVSNGANPLIFYTNSSERARIDSSGKLLVGTTTAPSSAKLAVAGGLSVNNNTDSGTNSNNYGNVFAKTVSVNPSTTTTIKNATGSESAMYLVSGVNSGLGIRFFDVVVTLTASMTPVVVSSGGINSPPARTYSMSGENLQVNFGGANAFVIFVTGMGANEAA